MGAKQTLNQIYLCVALVLASLLGMATGSWVVFVVSLVLLIAANIHVGRIRPDRRGRRKR